MESFKKKLFLFFEKIAKEKKAPLFLAEKIIQHNFTTDLKGNYQQKNIKTVLQTVEVLTTKGFEISNENLEKGLQNVVKNTGLLGRWQTLQEIPKAICDTGHNKEGLHYVFQQLQEEKFEKLHIVFGVVNDKDLKSILPLFPKNAIYYFCKPEYTKRIRC